MYVKATESTTHRNPHFSGQDAGARTAGLIRGAYHFALPNRSYGARQAAYFVRHGGDRRADGRTPPPAPDVEYNPYSTRHKCYGPGKARRTGRRPVVRTTTRRWRRCTGDSRAFASSNPLRIARHGTARPGALPGDQDLFDGSAGRPRTFARGRRPRGVWGGRAERHSGPVRRSPPCRSQFIFRSPRLLTFDSPMTSNDCLGKWKASR
ncbi:GH25 family lysozyme [Streptomyces dangxiongensis]|uniref:GH25 family lysozyme n=1 Tax=Streptomyces dangxiongensis TaxID=1442032 RepID=UPI0026C8FEC5